MLQMFLRSDVAEKLARAYQAGRAPSAKQLEEFRASRAARPKYAARVEGARAAASAEPENYAVVGSVAQICIEGVLSEEPDFWAWIFGLDGTTYADIRDAFALAGADPLVKSVVLDVCSPGGYCAGLFETLAVVEAFGKPVTVQAAQACSAAYSLAAMAGPITAKGPAASFGSVGVACTYCFSADEEVIDVTSTNAPDKRPDPRTPEGKAVIVRELDAIHDLFVDAIARGRTNATGTKYTVAQVNADFGRGAVLLTAEAKAAGLIDKAPRAAKRGSSALDDSEPEASTEASTETLVEAIKPPSAPAAAPAVNQPRTTGPTETKKLMNADELKAQHPELFAAVKKLGADQEHDRVCAHLTLGEQCGNMKLAVEAITANTEMTATMTAKYLAAGMNRADQNTRQAESETAAAAVKGVKTAAGEGAADGGKDLTDTVAELAAAQRNKTL